MASIDSRGAHDKPRPISPSETQKVARPCPTVDELPRRPGVLAAAYASESLFRNTVEGFGMVAQDKDARAFRAKVRWTLPNETWSFRMASTKMPAGRSGAQALWMSRSTLTMTVAFASCLYGRPTDGHVKWPTERDALTERKLAYSRAVLRGVLMKDPERRLQPGRHRFRLKLKARTGKLAAPTAADPASIHSGRRQSQTDGDPFACVSSYVNEVPESPDGG